MKRISSLTLCLVALSFFGFAALAQAGEVASEGLVSAQVAVPMAVPVAEAESVDGDSAAVEFPVQPEFVSVAAEGGTCTSCSTSSQCTVACGGFGACLRDLGLECGNHPQDKYCFC